MELSVGLQHSSVFTCDTCSPKGFELENFQAAGTSRAMKFGQYRLAHNFVATFVMSTIAIYF